MSLFNRFKKKDMQPQQNADDAGMIFSVHLLMEEMCDMPKQEHMQQIMNKHLGETECFCYDERVAGFEARMHMVHFEEDHTDIPPQLLITNCMKIDKPVIDGFSRSQLWDCPEGSDILDICRYHVFATEVLTAGLNYKERAELLVDYIEALVELYPTCKAVVFETSKKMLARDTILNCTMPKEDRFIYYTVNVRFFNVQGTDDILIDTIGMSILNLPDLQYHFHSVSPDEVANHAYNVLAYIYDNENPIENGDHIDGIGDGGMSRDVQWTAQYEEALIQPVREVIDINMGSYASGHR